MANSPDPEFDQRIQNKFIRNVVKPYAMDPFISDSSFQGNPEPTVPDVMEDEGIPSYKIETPEKKHTVIQLQSNPTSVQSCSIEQCKEICQQNPNTNIFLFIIVILIIILLLQLKILYTKK